MSNATCAQCGREFSALATACPWCAKAHPAEWVYGACLPATLRKQVLAMFVNRHTGEHRPKWVERDRTHDYKPLYATDLEWLHNTEFAITKGGALDGRVHRCISHDPKRKPAP